MLIAKKCLKALATCIITSDILEKGFSGGHLRFFLIYGSYREKLNFTFEKLAETSRKLDSLKSMLKELQEAQVDSANTELNAPIGSIISDFESCLNNDLDVKTAFDSLYETISGLHKKRGSLSAKNVKKLMRDLRRIDSVLQCIF